MRSFKEATSDMTLKGKIGYVWEYYKWHIIGGIAGFTLVFSMVHAFVTQRDTYLSVTFISGFEHTQRSFEGNVDDDPFAAGPPGILVDFEIIPVLEDLLLKEYGDNYEISVTQLGINIETIPVLSTHLGAGVMDLIVTYELDFDLMVEIEYFHNLIDLGWDIPEHMMHDSYGIYLRYLPIFDDYISAADDLIVGVVVSSSNLENIERFFGLSLE